MEQMTLRGLLAEEQDGQYTVITLGPTALDVLDHGVRVRIRQAIVVEPPKVEQPPKPVNTDLLAALKVLRMRLAQEAKVPAYVIFSNATLEDMSAKMPTNLDDFLKVNGVGAKKAHQYGAQFLEVIRYHTKMHNA